MDSNKSISTAIHNAFLLGWSLMGLKSRVQVTACNVTLDTILSNPQKTTFVEGSDPPPLNSSAVNQQPSLSLTASTTNRSGIQVSSSEQQQINPPDTDKQIKSLSVAADRGSDNTEQAEPLLPLHWGKSAIALRLTLIKQAEVWRALIMGERDLQSFNTLKVTQNILNDFMQDRD